MKYLVVTGGVVSGLGKGITISSLGVLLQARGLKCGALKIDGYLNVDAGTMSPLEHGECFVLADGGEVDLDAGNYERHLGIRLTRDHSLTTGKIYSQVIAAERQGQYLGKTVQVIPHVTDAIQDWIERVAHMPVEPAADAYSSSAVSASASATSAKVGAAAAAGGAGADDDSDDDSDGDSRRAVPGTPDVFLVEVGGTVGDIESLVFLEAMRQFAVRVGHENVVFVHLSLVPVVGGEQKTKPTQHSVKELRSLGISPDILVCRSAKPLLDSTRTKLALHCQVAPEALLVIPDVPNIHHVPLVLEEQHAADIIARRMRLPVPTPGPDFGPTAAALARWREIAHVVDTATAEVHIALVGKYTGLQDSYLSVIKSLQHAAIAARKRLVIDWIDAAALEPATEAEDAEAFASSWAMLRAADGVLVPGGFGDRGVEGKIAAVRYARENRKPFLGICLGMQCAVIEYARHKLGLAGANSAEFNPSAPHKLVIFMPEGSTTHMGGTMRLGARQTLLKRRLPRPAASGAPAAGASDGASGGAAPAVAAAVAAGSAPVSERGERSLASELYGRDIRVIWERHRHRYEVNPDYVASLAGAGLHFTGTDERGVRMEIVELDRAAHPFFFAVQYHPEFQSSPHCPSPPFLGLILAAKGELEKRLPLDLTAARRARGLAVGGSSSGAHSGAPSVAVDAAAGAFGAGSAVATPPRGIASASASAPGSPVLHADGSSGAAHPAKRSSFSIPAAAPAAPVVGRLREDLLPSSAGAVMRPFESSPLRPALGAASSSSSSSSTAAAGGGRVSHPPLASDLVDGSSAAAGK